MYKVVHFVVGIEKQIALGFCLNRYEIRIEALCFYLILNWSGE